MQRPRRCSRRRGAPRLRPPRLQRVLVFFAAWGQMLTYIITVAISAFFVPHYLGVFWEPLGESPADIVGGIVVVVVLAVGSTSWASRSRRGERLLGGRGLPHPGAAGGGGGGAGVSTRHPGCRSTSAPRRRYADFLIAIPVGMVAYTGIETISNMAEEARDYGHTIPRGIGGSSWSPSSHLRLPAGGRAVGDAGGGRRDLARASEGGGGYADDPILGVVANMDLGTLQGAAEIYVGILAATILFIATNAGNDRRLAAHLLDGPVPPAAGAACARCTRGSAPPTWPSSCSGWSRA